MKCSKEMMLLYAVTDRAWLKNETLAQQVEKAIQGGVTMVQLREKKLDEQNFYEEALPIKEICNKYHVPFIINDNVELAMKCKADGIHVGQSDMKTKNVRKLVGKDMIIGVSAQTKKQAIDAEKNGADYLGVGAVFSTSTKLDASDVSFDTLKEICESVNIPVVAIGGINKNNILHLSGSGVDGVALVSAIFASEKIEEECKILKQLSSEMTKS